MLAAEAPGRRERIATAILLACAAAALLARVPQIEDSSRGEYCRDESDFHIERGEALLHGVPLPGLPRAMPSYSVPNAFLCGHLSSSNAAAVRFAVLLACAVLVFALGALLYSALCGAGAALLYAFAPPAGESGERWLYTLAVLLAAFFIVRRAQSPPPAKSVGLPAALGSSLLMLSTLRLFPFLLALYEWARERRAGASRWKDAAGVCLLPFLFLVPWIVMNWRLTGRFVLFEDGRADDNILTGALGFVRTMGIGDSRKMAGIDGGENVFLWAALRILRHPLVYLSAVGLRAAFAAGLHPALAVAAAGSMWLSRRREDCRQLALLAGYLFGIHLLMPVQENYFAPAWPILAVFAAGLAGAWTRPASPRLKELSAAAAASIFAVLLAVQACVLGLVLAYPSRAARDAALDGEVERHPRDAWLRSERGLRLLREGRPAEAAVDLGRALSLAPSRDRELAYAWALLARGGPAARIWERRRPGRIFMLKDIRERALRGIYLALNGRTTEAVAVETEVVSYKRSHETAGQVDVAAGSPAPPVVLEVISSWPAATRPAVIEFFAGVPGFVFAGKNVLAENWLDMASTAEKANQRQTALELLAFTESMRLDPKAIRKLASAYRDSAHYVRALTALKRTELGGAKDADLLLDIAARAASDEQRPAAMETLGFASSLNLDREKLFSLALAYRDIGGYSRSLAILKRPELAGPKGSDMLLDTAAMAAKGGRRREALEILAFVESTRLDPERARRLALAYQDAAGYSRALAVMRKTDMSRPADVNMLLALAAAAAKRDQKPAALAALVFVESLKLDTVKIRALALAYRDLGDYSRALAVLRPSAGPNDAGMFLDFAVRAARDKHRAAALASLAFAEGLKLDADGMRSLAMGYRALGEPRSAERVRRRMGDEDGLAIDRAETAAASGDRTSALASLARVRDAGLVEEEARRLVLAYQGLGEYPAALAVVGRRLVARPRDARWRNDSGVLHALLGKQEDAGADWTAAIALDPDFLPPYLSLGSQYASLTRRNEALDLYQRALSRRHAQEDAGILKQILAERRKLMPSRP